MATTASVSQVAVEVVSTATPISGQVSQIAVEVVSASPVIPARLSQAAIEVLVFPSPPVADVILLIGAETAIIDESDHARPLTVVGNAARTTAQVKYGVASITFDGTGDSVQAADSTDFTFGSDNFTVEGWFRFVTKQDSQALMGQWDDGGFTSNCSWFLFIVSSALTLRLVSSSGTTTDVTYAWAPTLGQWYHIAADRQGSTVRLYVNGAVVSSNTSYSSGLNDSTAKFTLGTIGTTGSFSSFDYNGQMDEIRLTKGVARYAGAFTPPGGSFPRAVSSGVATATGLAPTLNLYRASGTAIWMGDSGGVIWVD